MEDTEDVIIENTLILVKHADADLEQNIAPSQWQLGDKGLKQAKKFTQFVQENFDVDSNIYSSTESKAKDTAMVLTETLKLNHKEVEGLNEIDRSASSLLDEEAYEESIASIFNQMDKAVLGNESASSALARFEQSIQEIVKDPIEDERLVVTHGIVMSLFLAKYNTEMKAFDIWKKLSAPSYVVVNVPDFKILELNGQPLKN